MNVSKRFFLVITLTVATMLSSALPALAKKGDVSTWFGRTAVDQNVNALNAFFDRPLGFLADSSCNLYVADTLNNVIRRIDGTTNVVTTVAGSGEYGFKNGTAASASFRNPSDVELGSDGAVYVADTKNDAIRIIKNGSVTTWLSSVGRPSGLFLDGTTLYMAEKSANSIIKATVPNGSATPVATIASPNKIVVYNGYLYVVHKGTSLSRVNLSTNATETISSSLKNADGLTIYNGMIYVVAGENGVDNEIWKYDPSTGTFTMLTTIHETEWLNRGADIAACGGKFRVLYESGASVFTWDTDGTDPVRLAGAHRWGDLNGSKAVAVLGRPKYLVLSPNKKTVYMIENHKIKKITVATKTLEYIAGTAMDNYIDGIGLNSRVSGPSQMALSPDGTKLYLADRNNNRIRKLDLATAELSTLTGAGYVNQFIGAKNAYAEGRPCTSTLTTGASGCAYFSRPDGIAITSDGRFLYVSDSGNSRIRRVSTTTGKTTLIAGSGVVGKKDAVGKKAQFDRPTHLLLSSDNKTLYVIEQRAHRIRQINIAARKVTTLTGFGNAGYRDGTFRTARFSLPNTLVFGANKNTLYLSEGGSRRIRELNLLTRRVTTLAGSGKAGSVSGKAKNASFQTPAGLMLLSSNTLLVADENNDLIRAVKLK